MNNYFQYNWIEHYDRGMAGRLREHLGEESGHVEFMEGFLEEVMSKMNPDR